MSKLTQPMEDCITNILEFPLTTYVAKQLRDQGLTSEDVNPISSRVGWNEIYHALKSMENANLAFPHPCSTLRSVAPDDLPDISSFLVGK